MGIYTENYPAPARWRLCTYLMFQTIYMICTSVSRKSWKKSSAYVIKPPTIKIQYRVRFVCLMFFVPLKNFSFKHHGDVVTIIDKGPQILTYTRHLLPSSRATPIVTRVTHLYILEDRCHSHHLPSVWQWSCHYSFKDLDLHVVPGIRTPNFHHAKRTL